MTDQLFHHQIIQSALDLDVYKINMMHAAHKLYPEAHVRYELIVRSKESLSDLVDEVRAEIAQLAHCTFSEEDLSYLKTKAPYLSDAFLNYLRYFRFVPQRQITVDTIHTLSEQKQLRVSIEGSWKDTILYETLVMSIISEVRNRRRWNDIPHQHFMAVLKEKIDHLQAELVARNITNFSFSEMGTRRRFSYPVQHDMLDYVRQTIPHLLSGTSNYHLARKFNLTPIGTVAHEWFMAHQAMVNVRDSQGVAIDNWHTTFDGELGIALTDTIGIDAFLQDFNYRRAKAYAGVRHDSGSPFVWGDKIIAHYQKMGIDPMSKLLIFTDGLNFERALEICEYFAGRARISFGIGTFLANDMGDWHNAQGAAYEPLSMVVKMTECNGSPVAKISDEPEKAMCEDPFFLMNLKQRFGIAVDLDQAIATLQSMKRSQHPFQIVA